MTDDQLIALYDELEAAHERAIAEIHAQRALVIAARNQRSNTEEKQEHKQP